MATRAHSQKDFLARLTRESARAVSAVFPSDAEMARATGVSRSRVTRWKQGERAGDEGYLRLTGLMSVILILADHFEPPTINAWLHGINANLRDQRPVDAIARGRIAEVIMAAHAERTGSFA